MAKIDLDSPELYINRELSWLEFNQRVLSEGRSPSVPLMERLKFLAIVGSNLDEFFMIRVAGLSSRVASGLTSRDPAGLTAEQQLNLIGERVHRMMVDHAAALKAAFDGLASRGLRFLDGAQLTTEQTEFLEGYFVSEVLPVLTPLAVAELHPFPALPGLTLNLAFLLGPASPDDPTPRIAIVPVPGNMPRFITVPADKGMQIVRLEHLIRWNVRRLFPQSSIEGGCEFRLTRDADISIDEDDVSDLLGAVEAAVRERRRRAVVRLEVSSAPDPRLTDWLVKWCDVDREDVYEADFLGASALMDIASRPGFESLRDPDWPPQPPKDLLGGMSVWKVVQERDVLLFHPYESFNSVVTLVEEAAGDPAVIAIKQTLYRTSGDSPVVRALARAAESGKQVTVLVELMARFDEARNAGWARSLEDAGCHVIYGVAGYKTHAKLLLIIRREAHGIRRYVHVSTGNYNDRTARIYSDVALLTTNPDFASDASAFFNLLTGYSQDIGWSRFTISPKGLRQKFVRLIDREVGASTVDQPGLIMAKVNSLQDKAVCKALYKASQAGVKVLLNVRGICCLRPGVKDVSENIRVVSIVDRFLEHARVFYFRNGGREEAYLSSADWMERNLDQRLEVLFPVIEPSLRKRLIGVLETYFSDNTKASQLLPDGTYEPVKRPGPPVRAQEKFYLAAVEAAKTEERPSVEFRPLTSPKSTPGT